MLLAQAANGNGHGTLGDTLQWVVIAVLTGAGLLFVAWLNNGRTLMNRVNELTTQILASQRSEIKCQSELVKLEEQLKAAVQRIRALESHTGTGSDISPIPGVVVARPDGIIVVYSPSLVPILGWLPIEMEGRQVTTLIPPEVVHQHTAAFRAFVAKGEPADPAKTILSYALTKSNARVPVSINLKSLPAEKLIVAEIRQRPRDASPTT